MKYELLVMDELITVALNPKNLNKEKNKTSFLKKCIAIVSAEVERINKVLIQEIIGCGIEKQVGCYVHQHQHGIIRLMDIQQRYLLKENKESIYKYPDLKTFIENYKTILSQLKKILQLLLNNFEIYYDKDYKIADSTRLSLVPEIKKINTHAITTLEKNKIDSTLIGFMSQPFEYFLDTGKFINQRDLEYLEYFRKEANLFFSKEEINSFDVYVLLIRLNLIDPSFTFYYIEKLKENETKDTLAGHTEYYYLQLKIINQVIRIPGLAFDHSLPSLAGQIGGWLTEEIYFLEKSRQLSTPLPYQKNDQADAIPKVQTSLSVAHLSLGLKLLMDAGVITNKNSTELMRMVARNFRTERRENISEDSLRNKAYNIESGTVDSMKDVIIGLLNLVRRY